MSSEETDHASSSDEEKTMMQLEDHEDEDDLSIRERGGEEEGDFLQLQQLPIDSGQMNQGPRAASPPNRATSPLGQVTQRPVRLNYGTQRTGADETQSRPGPSHRRPPPPPTHDMSSMMGERNPPVRRYGATDSSSDGESSAVSLGDGESPRDDVLPPVHDSDIEFWEAKGLSKAAGRQLAEIHRLVGDEEKGPALTELEIAPSIRDLYSVMYRTSDVNGEAMRREFGDVVEEKFCQNRVSAKFTRANTKDGSLEFSSVKINVISTAELNTIGRGDPLARESHHHTAATHPKCMDGEDTIGMVHPWHEAFALDLAFLKDEKIRVLVVSGDKRLVDYPPPLGLTAVPVMSQPIGQRMGGREKMSIRFSQVGITQALIEQLQKVPTLVSLSFDRCPLLDTVRIENFDKLEDLTSCLIPVAKGIKVTMDFKSLPSIRRLVVNTDTRVIVKNYRREARNYDTSASLDPKVSISNVSLFDYTLINQQMVELEILDMRFHGEDLARMTSHNKLPPSYIQREDVFHAVATMLAKTQFFMFRKVATLKTSCSLSQTVENMFIPQRDDLHIHCHTLRSLQDFTRMCVQDALGGTISEDEESRLTADGAIQSMYWSDATLLNSMQVFQIWEQILSMNVEKWAMNQFMAISMGFLSYFRNLNNTERMRRNLKRATSRSEEEDDYVEEEDSMSKLLVKDAEKKLGIRLEPIAKPNMGMLFNSAYRTQGVVPMIIFNVSPLVDTDGVVNLLRSDPKKLPFQAYILRNEYDELLRNISEGCSIEKPSVALSTFKEGTVVEKTTNMNYRDLVMPGGTLMPFDEASHDKATRFPCTYIILARKDCICMGPPEVVLPEEAAIKVLVRQMEFGVNMLNTSSVATLIRRGICGGRGDGKWCTIQ